MVNQMGGNHSVQAATHLQAPNIETSGMDPEAKGDPENVEEEEEEEFIDEGEPVVVPWGASQIHETDEEEEEGIYSEDEIISGAGACLVRVNLTSSGRLAHRASVPGELGDLGAVRSGLVYLACSSSFSYYSGARCNWCAAA